MGAIAFAGDLAFGFRFEDSVRSCYAGMRLAEELDLSADERLAIYYTGLLKDAGCTCWTSQLAAFWMTDEIVARRELLVFGDPTSPASFIPWLVLYVGSELPLPSRLLRMGDVFLHQRAFMQEGFETACEVAGWIAARLAMPPLVQEAVVNLFERWDGKGAPSGLRGEQIPRVARVVFGRSSSSLSTASAVGRLRRISPAHSAAGPSIRPSPTLSSPCPSVRASGPSSSRRRSGRRC